MDLFAPFVRNVIAPIWAMKEGSPYLRHLRYLEKSQYYSLEKTKEIQWEKLKKLLIHAYQNVIFYRQNFDILGIQPEDIRTWDDFSNLKILTKEDIRKNQYRMIANNYSRNKLISKKTSGSTGISLEIFIDEFSLQWKRACNVRHDRWAGWDIGDRVAAIWGNPEYLGNWRLKLRNLLLDRYTYLDTLKMDEVTITEFYNKILRKPPALLFGHAHSLYLFAQFLRQKGWYLPKHKGIISTAMILHNHERKLIEKVFNSKVFNRYGCEEVSLIASECEEHRGLHINSDTLIVEVIRDNNPVKAGEPGSIVVTDLSNFAMPLIRYKIGDVGILAKSQCACGRGFPLLESITGRTADYVVTPEGKYISGISLTENFAMKLPEIKQLQIVQDKIDHLKLRIVCNNFEDNQLKIRINELFKDRFGSTMKYDIEYVKSIQQEISGKYRFCISEIDNPFT
ncbi:MAG: hypothetical protein K8R74_06200 [Bacteroidales bacterium]|nr:hypothetical protein [Bacteroidales bacterium]